MQTDVGWTCGPQRVSTPEVPQQRAQLRADIAAANTARIGPGQIRPLVHEADLQIRAWNLDMRRAVASARAAVFALRPSFKSSGGTAPSVTTPPASSGGGLRSPPDGSR